MDDIYFEDIVVGTSLQAGRYVLPEQEMMAFAAAWDPMPMHIDKDYAAKHHGGLSASGTYLLAVKLRLIHSLPIPRTVIASTGYDELRFHRPVRVGEPVSVRLEWIGKRRSRSKPDRGIVTAHNSLLDAKGEAVLSHRDTLIMRLRDPEA
jgi:acyl dehydratase